MQNIINHLKVFSDERQLRINSGKSGVMRFWKSRTKAFPIEIEVDGAFLEVKKEMKILGVILTANLKWEANTDFICKKAYKQMWPIRRMKSLGNDSFTLIDYNIKEVRVHLELAS